MSGGEAAQGSAGKKRFRAGLRMSPPSRGHCRQSYPIRISAARTTERRNAGMGGGSSERRPLAQFTGQKATSERTSLTMTTAPPLSLQAAASSVDGLRHQALSQSNCAFGSGVTSRWANAFPIDSTRARNTRRPGQLKAGISAAAYRLFSRSIRRKRKNCKRLTGAARARARANLQRRSVHLADRRARAGR